MKNKAAISIVIIFVLTLGAISALNFKLIYKPLRGSPDLWPFLDYPMYSTAHYEGEEIEHYAVFGTLEDATEVPILPEDFGLHFWIFRRTFVFAMLGDDQKQIKDYAELYNSRHNKYLTGLRLENHPLILSGNGANPGLRQILRNVRLETLEK